MDRKRGASGAAEVLEDLSSRERLGSGGCARTQADRSALGVLAPIGLLFQPGLDGLPAIAHVTAHPIADWAVALGPPAVRMPFGYRASPTGPSA